jgi:hypothetical protein
MGSHTAWVSASAILVTATCLACGEAASVCPSLGAGIKQPVEVEARATRLTTGGNIDALIVDEAGLYWYDASGAIFSLPRGQSQPVELRPAPAPGELEPGDATEVFSILGFTSDGERLYWGEGFRYAGVDAGGVEGYKPPGRLMSMPKSGGSATVVIELADSTIEPLRVEGTRSIVRLDGVEAGLYKLDLLHQHLERLPAPVPADSGRVVGNHVYWTEPDEKQSRLYRAGFDAAPPELITTIEGNDFEVGPDYILSQEERHIVAPQPVLDQNFVLHDDATGCTQPLPGVGETLSFSRALDAQHVYWYSFNGLAPVSACTDPGCAEPPPAEASMPLLRVNLDTGLLERLDTPGFELLPTSQILGQDAQSLYISTASGLVAVTKP